MTPLESHLRASLSAVKGPPAVLLSREELPSDEALAVTQAQLALLCCRRDPPGAFGFGVDPEDSAALQKLREAIDEHLPHYEPEHEAGDYEAIVRIAGEELLKHT